MPKPNMTVHVHRFDPTKDNEPRYKSYKVPIEESMTVLDTLMYVNDNIEPIALRYECRFWDCGACGVMANGRPVLACKQAAQDGMKIGPLPIFPVIKDLVVDIGSYYRKRSQLRPFIERVRKPKEFPEPEVTYEVAQKYRQYVDCIDCLLCQVVCPVLKKPGTKFIGPALITYIARFAVDSRDELDRVTIALSEGLSECTLCGECNKVCPKGRNIAEVDIMRLRELAKERELM